MPTYRMKPLCASDFRMLYWPNARNRKCARPAHFDGSCLFDTFLAIVSTTEEFMADEKPDFQKVKAFVDEKWQGSVVCPICKTTQWSIYAQLVNAPVWKKDTVLPMVRIYCNNCSYSMFLSAVTAKALPPDPPKSESEGD
jgi:hypothetical protein